jgi:hypothetical protein
MQMNSLACVGLVVAAVAFSYGCGDEEEGGANAGGGGGGTSTSSGSGSTPTDTSSSSGSGSATSGGGSTSTSSGTGGSAGTACGSLPLCDDFESAAIEPGTWTLEAPNCNERGTSIAIDSSQAHSGSYSVKVTGAGGYCNHLFLTNESAVSSIDGPIFGRFFVRFEHEIEDGHTTFAAFHDSSQNKDLRMGGQSRILMWNRESDDATLPELSPTGISMSVRPTPGQWLCVEYRVDGATGTLTTWIDGAEVAGLVVDGTPTPDVDAQWLRNPGWRPQLVSAGFGWEGYGGQSMNLWFDDIAVGPARIGCGN